MGKFVKVLASIRHPVVADGSVNYMSNLCLLSYCTLFYAHSNKTRRLTQEERYKIAIQLTQSLNYLQTTTLPSSTETSSLRTVL
jgi:hypothetical protein